MNPNVLNKDKIRVEWDELGEGICGDYNSDDPEDIELLRFTVSRCMEDGTYEQINDASYCTQVPVSATNAQRKNLLKWLMSEVYEDASKGNSIKKLCERLSWISLDSIVNNCIDQTYVL